MPPWRDMRDNTGSIQSESISFGPLNLSGLLSPEVNVHSLTRRVLGEKRIISRDNTRIVLTRHIVQGAARRISRRHRALQNTVPLQREIPLVGNFTWRPFGWWRAVVFEDGVLWHDTVAAPLQVRALATALSALHAHEAVQEFPLFGAGQNPRRILRLARQAVMRSSALPHADREMVLDFISRHAESLHPVAGCRLVHGDLHPRNLIILPDARICLIDSEGVAPGLPLLEFAHALLNLFEGPRASLRRPFVRHYMTAQTDEVRRHWRQHGPSLLVFARLLMAWRRYRRACVLAKRGARDEARFAVRFHERFLRQACQHASRIRQP